MVAFWNEKFRNGARWVKPVFVGGIALGIFALAIMYQSNLIGKIAGRLLPGEKDPARRVRAWKEAAAIVEDARKKFEAEGEPAFIICSHYGITGVYSFYSPQARQGVKNFRPLTYSV